MIEFGKTYRDIISGFQGICTCKIESLYGCEQFILIPRSETNSKKEHGSVFYEKQLEYVDDGVADKVDAPVIFETAFLGKECVDKLTGIRGICTGRYIWLFNGDQYILEYRAKDDSLENKGIVLDEGRVELVPDPEKEIKPEDVSGSRPGGYLPLEEYPDRSCCL